MKCADAAELILEADPADLRGEGDGALARHLRTCPKCAALAQVVLEEERVLAAEILEVVPSPDLDEIMDRAQLTAGPGRSKPLVRFKRARMALVPLAAAAAGAMLFLGGEPQLPGISYSPPDRTAGLGLEVPEGRNAAVLRTGNPDITVLWFF